MARRNGASPFGADHKMLRLRGCLGLNQWWCDSKDSGVRISDDPYVLELFQMHSLHVVRHARNSRANKKIGEKIVPPRLIAFPVEYLPERRWGGFVSHIEVQHVACADHPD